MQRKHRYNSIRSQLFVQVAIIVTVTSLALMLVSSFIVNDLMEDKARREIAQVGTSISSQFSSVIQSMESISRQLQYSTVFKEQYYRMVHTANPLIATSMSENLHAQIKGIFDAAQSSPKMISVQSLYGHEVTVGAEIDAYVSSPQAITTNMLLTRAQLKHGTAVLSAPHESSDHEVVISLVSFLFDPDTSKRLYFDTFIEVQQSYQAFTDIVEAAVAGTGMEVMVVMDDGRFVVPAHKNTYGQSVLYTSIRKKMDSPAQAGTDILSVRHPVTGEAIICGLSAAGDAGLTVIVYESEAEYLAGMRSIVGAMAMLALALLLLSLLWTWQSASRITAPITALRKEVGSINLHTLQRELDVHFSHHEYEDLNNTFSDMLSQLRKSVDEIVDLKQKEMRTRLYALQTKMDPHFLNNAIALIQIYARKDDIESIKEICTHLNGMTRYLYKTSSEIVPLSAEVTYAQHYLDMMQTRYPDSLCSSIDIPESMLGIMLPKLILQPLIENCFKHGMAIAPPWTIRLRGRLLEDGRFFIEVEDNGVGFPDSVRQQLLTCDGSEQVQTGSEGIGLMNIIARIRLIYGDSAIVAIETPPGGGALVRVGGSVKLEGRYL